MGEEGVKRLLEQKPKDKNKLYSLHASKVECIGKGKARHPYEFGVKITVTTMYKEGLVVGMRSLPGNSYDAHTLTIWRSGQRRGLPPSIRKAIHRRSVIEPAIGPMKNEGKLRRNWLKRSPGDALNALLCGASHNLRMILRALWLFLARILCFWVMSMNPTNSQKSKFNYLSVWRCGLFRTDYLS